MGEPGYTAQSHMNQMDQSCYSVKKHLCVCMGASSVAGKEVCVCVCVCARHVCKMSVFFLRVYSGLSVWNFKINSALLSRAKTKSSCCCLTTRLKEAGGDLTVPRIHSGLFTVEESLNLSSSARCTMELRELKRPDFGCRPP